MSDSQPALISVLPPSRAQERAALVAAFVLMVLFLLALLFGHVQMAKITAFIPILSTVMFLTDSITALLLFAQFSILHSRALLVLASGYLFTALIVIPYALAFPDAFAPAGVLGAGMQAPPWFYSIWHIGLPTTIIAYVLLSNASPPRVQLVRGPVRFIIVASIAGIVVLVCGLTWFITAHDDLFPVLMLNDLDAAGDLVKVITWTVLSLCATAVVLLLTWRRSMLDLWLLVVSLAWLLDSVLFTYLQTRYTVAWYATRIFGMVAASFVLFVLLTESTMLYARLALSVLGQRREREARLMSIDAVTAAIAHEIRQPLGAIVANANAGLRWLGRTPPGLDKARDTFKDIAADGQRASDVIESVRGMFGKSEQPGTPLNTNELIQETIAIVRGELEAARIAVQLDLGAQLPLVSAHRGQLQQVILNIIANAADAMRSITDRARVLAVKSETFESNGVAVSIIDSGTGIDPKHADRIFEPFFTTKSNGMGMGLAICRSIVEGHGGTLSVSRGMPYGSVFRLVLPSNVSVHE